MRPAIRCQSRVFAILSLTAFLAASLPLTADRAPVFEPIQAFEIAPRDPQGKLVQGPDGEFYGTTADGGASGQGTTFKVSGAGKLTTLFHFMGENGSTPKAGMILASDGNFYGTTSRGGSGGYGTVFRMAAGGQVTTVANFGVGDGSDARASLLEGPDGNFYGTTFVGGTMWKGTVFKVTPGGTLTTLASFTGPDGSNPRAELVLGNDGNFYGTTEKGGNESTRNGEGFGTVFRITSGGNLSTLVSFNRTNGASPTGALVLAPSGDFYGTTSWGGTSADLPEGTLFKVSPGGSLTTLKVMMWPEGCVPQAGMTLGSDGNFYGTTSQGGKDSVGITYRLTPNGSFSKLADFNQGGGQSPRVPLLQGRDGHLYGVQGASAPEIDSGHPGSVFRITLEGALSTFADFAARDGKELQAGLVEGNDGILYGATYRGGRNNQGTDYQVTPGGLLTTLVHFDGQNGSAPGDALIRGSDGNLYGTTAGGGLSNRGTVFRMTPAGALTTLVSFNDTNGNFPRGRLVEGGDGFLYGSTLYGGSGFKGTVFKIGLQGLLTTLVNFNGANGSGPAAELVPGSGGNFYGTTPSGGTSDMGTVFRMTRSGALTTLVHFTGSNGRRPEAGLVQGRDGNFYGATTSGGSSSVSGGSHGWGTFFRMSPAGSLTTLVSLSSVDLGTPPATLIQGMDGNFYGTAPGNVFAGRFGVVFRMTPEGGLTTVHEFNNSFGRYPYSAGLIQASDGNLYGTTTAGGITSDGKPAGGGQIYRLRLVPLPVPDIGVEAPSGTGLVLGAASVGFGSITVGASSAVEFTLRNSGTAELTELAVTIGGMDAGDFTVVGSPAASLPGPGGNTVFSVRFLPLGDGPRTAELRIGSNDPDEGGFVIALSGTGVPAVPEISIMQPVGSDLRDGGAKKSFGTIKLGKRGPSEVFTIVNRGTARLTGLSISKKGGQMSSFQVTPPVVASLAPGESTTFEIRFKPSAIGPCNTAIRITSNDADESPFDIRLSGFGAKR